jgi:hypothetical protein
VKRLGWLAALGLAGLLASPVLLAEGASRTPSASASAPPASSRPQASPSEQAEEVLRRYRALGIPLPSGLASALPPPVALPSAGGAPPPGSSALPLSQELLRKWQAFTASRSERRAEHRAALVRELGAQLETPAVKSELRVHATRVAELARIRFLAENARSGAEREKLLARVDKLSEREARRHHKQLAALAHAVPGAASGARLQAAAPAPSTVPSAGGSR